MLWPHPHRGARGMRMLAKRIERLEANDFGRTTSAMWYACRRDWHRWRRFSLLYASFCKRQRPSANRPSWSNWPTGSTPGDDWRNFALRAARMIKGREPVDFALSALRALADQEEAFFRALRQAVA